ncbi:unnamed protein product [Sphenostylis stenocarpa]|uniref:Uncharacterized protein n=1 Tax=Sphenostylis stenocarpa TaxID=92480 RepID=A0AA86VYV6_9FABA|nr:unnamed protein product [Sphenostylis stenocarpa]
MESKNKGKRSLLTRLKPTMGLMDVSPLSSPVSKRNPSDPVLSYLAVADKDGAVLPAMLSSMFGVGDKCENRRRKWKAIRSALNETTLMRLVVKRRKANKNKLSLSGSSKDMEETSPKFSNPKTKITYRICPNVSPTSCSPSSSRASTSSLPSPGHVSSFSTHQALPSPKGVTKEKQCAVEDRKKTLYDSNIALCCLLALSLLVLVVWGKFLAILFTTIWLYTVPLGGRKICNEGGLCGERVGVASK